MIRKSSFFEYEEIDGELYASITQEKEKEIAKKKYEFLLQRSGIPAFYWKIDFKDYLGTKESIELKKILHYANNCHKKEFTHVNLFIYGSQSTQKTAIACNILKEAMRKGLRAKFVLAGVLIDKLMKVQGFNTNEKILDELQNYRDADILCIDDCWDIDKSLMWKGESKSIIISEWDIFLRDTISSNTRIIMTSNYSVDSIKQYYGVSLFELVDRSFEAIQLTESVKKIRKSKLSDVFKEIR